MTTSFPRLGAILYPMVDDEHGAAPLASGSLAANARSIEAAGLDSAWVYDVIGRGYSLPDPLVAVAVAASATDRIEVGTGVVQVPLRMPVELAHRVLTTQLVCDGRLLLGVGAGSTRADFDAVGVSYEERFQSLADSLEIMQRLWAGERVGDAELYPAAVVRGGPPVLIGSWGGSKWVSRGAQDYAGWIASAGMHNTWALLERASYRFREAGGSRAVLTNVLTDLAACADPDGPDDRATLCCPPEIAVERLRRFHEMGFTDVVTVGREFNDTILSGIAALRNGVR